MVTWIARLYGLIFVWHAIRHFRSYPLLGSQSYFTDPKPEWIILGSLQAMVGILLLYKPKAWHLFLAALTLFLWCSAYPVGRHVGDSAFILLLIGLAIVELGGDGWIPLATLPSITGLLLAGLWKLHGKDFSLCDLTNCVLVRFPWVDWLNPTLHHYSTITRLLSDVVICIELGAVLIWLLLFFPKLWLVRSFLALIPIVLLFGIGITGNLDEFPWIMLTAWLLMLGPKQVPQSTPFRWIIYPAALLLYTAALFNLEINLRRIHARENDYVFEKSIGILPSDRLGKMGLFLVAPYWNMYASPILHEQTFGGESSRIDNIHNRIIASQGCGLELNRWERIYWERVGRGLKNPSEIQIATQLKRRYEQLEGKPCSLTNTIIYK